jgi:hypothetical protein
MAAESRQTCLGVPGKKFVIGAMFLYYIFKSDRNVSLIHQTNSAVFSYISVYVCDFYPTLIIKYKIYSQICIVTFETSYTYISVLNKSLGNVFSYSLGLVLVTVGKLINKGR